MPRIELIQKTTDLSGSMYFEFYPGSLEHSEEEVWSEKSAFIFEEFIYVIEPILETNLENYWHYSATMGSEQQWNQIASELRALNELIRSAGTISETNELVKFQFQHTKDFFESDFESNKSDLVKMIEDLSGWISKKLESTSEITVRGI